MAEQDTLDVKSTEMGDDSSSSAESSQQDANAGKSMQDFVKESMARTEPTKDEDAPATETEHVDSEEEKKSDSVIEPDGDAEKVQDKTKPEGETEPEGDDEDNEEEQDKAKGPVPYERFKEVNEKAAKLEETVKAVEGDAKQFRDITSFLSRNNISSQQFVETMEIVAALNAGDFEKVGPKIKELYDQVQGLSGEKLPPDIQAKVDAGLDLETAKQWAKDRAKATLVETRSKKSVEQLQREQLNDYRRQTTDAVTQWTSSKQTADPDFKNGSLKWDEVQDRYSFLINAKNDNGEFVNPTRTAQDVVALLERSYKDVNERIKKRNNGRPLTRKVLSSNGSSGRSNLTKFEDAKTLSDAIKIGMQERGHTIN